MNDNAITSMIDDWIRPEIRDLSAYHVPDSSGLIKLDAMENPYTWPTQLTDNWLASLRDAPLNRYPDPTAKSLKIALRETFSIPDGVELMLGNGSDELIQMIAMAVSAPSRTLLATYPSFSMYRIIATMAGLDYREVPLNVDELDIQRDLMLASIAQHKPAIVFLDYPNNPSGKLFDQETICEIIETAPGLVVVDEAYYSFAKRSFIPQIARYSNLLVLRTLSKMGLAGLRLGFLLGRPDWIEQINKIRLPYNINILAQLSATFALKHYDVFCQQTDKICQDRDNLYREMSVLGGVQVYHSDANFLLFRVTSRSGNEVFEAIRQQGVLIKNLHSDNSVLSDCLRVTVGRADENASFLAALKSAL
ncbi:MAG: histidinol-phosphate transaminase [Gammaproteobacteria bacterium]